MFVLLFVYVFGGAIRSGGLDYVDYLLPGILVQTTLFGSTQTGVGLADDLQKGMIDRYKSLPMARSAVIAGRIAADIIRNSFVVSLMIGVGLAVGFRFHGGVAGFALPAVVIMFGVGIFLGDGSGRRKRQVNRGCPSVQLHVDVPANVPEFDVRTDRDDARLAATICRIQPCDIGCKHSPRPGPGR